MTDEKYPNGKLNDDDEGALMVKISTEKGVVRIDFGEPTQWFGMTPDMAVDMAISLVNNARQAGCKKMITISIG